MITEQAWISHFADTMLVVELDIHGRSNEAHPLQHGWHWIRSHLQARVYTLSILVGQKIFFECQG